MYAQNRRDERSDDDFKSLLNDGVESKIIYDLTSYENQNLFLEGTGSMVLDRINKKFTLHCLKELINL